MFNLIRKDIILQREVLIILLPFLLVYLFLDGSSILIGFIFSIAIIMNAFTYDEKSTINILLNTLPYTRKQIVSSKYIGALVFTFAVVFTILIGNLFIHREITSWKELLLIFGLTMVFISLVLPFSYKFKSQYLLVGSLILFVMYLVIITLVINNLNDRIREFMQVLLTSPNSNSQLYLIIAFSVIAIYVFSWLLSIRIYEKKVF